jgi:hypothetical protein
MSGLGRGNPRPEEVRAPARRRKKNDKEKDAR